MDWMDEWFLGGNGGRAAWASSTVRCFILCFILWGCGIRPAKPPNNIHPHSPGRYPPIKSAPSVCSDKFWTTNCRPVCAARAWTMVVLPPPVSPTRSTGSPAATQTACLVRVVVGGVVFYGG